jgi:hypothetical protein
MAATHLDIDAVVIESPCTVPWSSMSGDEVRRFCGQCRLHVHDVSNMTRREANELLRASNGQCCLRIWRRPDGRVITKDCSRVARALRRRLRVIATAAAGLLALLGIGGCRHAPATSGGAGARAEPTGPTSGTQPTAGAIVPPSEPGARPTMGTPPFPPAEPEKPPIPGATVTTGK